MLELRPYQREAIDSLYKYFHSANGNPLVVMPTGTGKSVVLAEFLREALHNWPDTRIVALTHVKELIEQNFKAMIRAWPEAPAGIYSAGLNRRDINSQIMFAGIQSIHRKAYDVQKCDLVLIDEAHLLNKSDTGMYRKFLSQLKQINPELKIVGLTATPFRMDQGMLTEGDDAIFTDIAVEIPLLKMIEEGYLVPLIPKQTKTQLDVSKVHVRGGEFIASELEEAVNTEEANLGAVNEIIDYGEKENRGSWLIFCSGLKHAAAVCGLIKERGISCEMISGDTPGPERDRILREFKEGKIRALTNMNVLTTGFDAPGVDLIGMLRPTKSQSLYVQMLGRGTRLAEGKDDCLILDFAGNTRRHGPVDTIKAHRPGMSGGGVAPTKTCPECQTILATATMECPDCGHVFPAPKIKIATKADTAPILSSQIESSWLPVQQVYYRKHIKADKPPSLAVTYFCGTAATHTEWICLEHPGYAREKAVKWWTRRSHDPVPDTIDDAMIYVDRLQKPKEIRIRPEGKYTRVEAYKFE